MPQTTLFAELVAMLRVQHSFGCFAEELAQFLGGTAFERIASDPAGLGALLSVCLLLLLLAICGSWGWGPWGSDHT